MKMEESEDPDSPTVAHSKTEKFEIRDFLRCNKIRQQESNDLLADNNYSLVLDNSKVVNFIRESKLRKTAPRNPISNQDRPQEHRKEKHGWITGGVFNFKTTKRRESTSPESSPVKFKKNLS